MIVSRNKSDLRQAFSLLECLVYLAAFFIVLGVAVAAYHEMDSQSRAFTRNSADIVRTTQAGERWREDVRHATNIALLQNAQEFRFAGPTGTVTYLFRDGVVWRQGVGEKQPMPFLSQVKSSVMKADARRQVIAWQWDVELQTKRTNAVVRPLFTFLAVPAKEAAR
jgi:hypothetical protein